MPGNKNLPNPLYKAERADWIKVGLASLSQNGRASLEIDKLAKKLNATKGSFYWHFKSKRDYELSLYAAFEKLIMGQLMMMPESPTKSNVAQLIAAGFLQIPYFEIRLELAIRDWARQDSTIFQKCSALDQKRLIWLTEHLTRQNISQPEIKASQIFALTVGYGLIPEFLGASHKNHYAAAILAILSA